MARKLKDLSWHSPDSSVYVGHQVSGNLIYLGGPFYEDCAQIHLTPKQAYWIIKNLEKAIARSNKVRP